MTEKDMTLQQRIEQVLNENIPILNDDVEALRKVCKVVWPEDRELNDFDLTSQYFFADPRNPSQWLAFNEHENSHLAIPASKFFEEEEEKPVMLKAAVISRLKSIRRFNLANYREGEFGIDTEREYDGNGDYIDSYEIDDIIRELEKGL